ncbi:MAG: class I SAM-dependent methyltransferase [Candidatus Omnitrophica bacterium]|nr:class I SAM-dependent methyltransferase [Candidatus Omnitrophota bacterium]
MNYRKEIYQKYVSNHTLYLSGKVDLKKIKKQFPVWGKYYGRYLPKEKNIKILEIGCGSGGFLYYLKSLGYENCVGIDISEEQIKSAKSLGVENVDIADLRSFLKDKDNSYDVIIARDVLEHFYKEEILEILKLIFQNLSKKGRLIIQSPNAEGLFGTKCRYGDFTHEIAFTSSGLASVLRVVGFKEMEFYPTEPVPKYSFKSAIRYCLWKFIELFLKAYILVETGNSKGIYTLNLICVAKK